MNERGMVPFVIFDIFFMSLDHPIVCS
jgi:hypothetical protein